MTIEKKEFDKVKMRKFVNTLMDNTHIQKIMIATHPEISENQIISVEPGGARNDIINGQKMNHSKSKLKKK